MAVRVQALRTGKAGAIVARLGRVHQLCTTPLLWTAYFLSIAALLITNVAGAAFFILQWIMIPLFVAAVIWPMAWLPARGIPPPVQWLRQSIVMKGVLVYLAALVIGTALRSDATAGIVRHDTVRAFQRSVEILFFLAITAYLATVHAKFFRLFFLALAALLLIKAVVDIAAFISLPKPAPFLTYRLEGAIGMPGYRRATHVAPLFAIYGLGALAMLASVQTRSWEKMVLAASCTVSLAVILLTQARGSVLVFLAGAILIVALSRLRYKWRYLSLIVIVAVAFILSETVRHIVLQRGDSFRLALAQAYLGLAMAKPWFGYGLGNEIVVTAQGLEFEQPHNMYVWAQVRGGIVAMVAALALMAAALFASFSFWCRGGNLAPFAVAAAMACTGFTEIGLLVTRFDWIWVTFWLPLGLAAGAELTLKTGVNSE